MSGHHRVPTPARPVLPLYRLLPVVEPSWSWGMLLPARGDGRCYVCCRPRWAVGVSREYGAEFVLCSRCWHRSEVTVRVRAHKWLMSRGSWSEAEVDAVLALVDSRSREAS